MNKTIETFARTEIKRGLHLLDEDCQNRFKLMYTPPADKRDNIFTPDEVKRIKTYDVEDVVDAMRDSDLDIALDQVERTLEKRGLLAGFRDAIQKAEAADE